MIDWLRRLISPGSYRKDETDAVVHGMRNQAQVADLQTCLFRTTREKRERAERAEQTGHFWVDAIRGARGDPE